MTRSKSVAVFAFLGAACAHATPTAEVPALEAPRPSPAPLDDCRVMRLVTLRDDAGGITRLLVRVERPEGAGLLIFDTGAPKTCLTHASSAHGGTLAGAGRFRLFCDEWTVDSIPKASIDPPIDGVPIIGNLGNDVLEAGVVEVDAQREIFALRPSGLTGIAGWTRMAIAFVAGFPVTDAWVDGTSYRMGFDTGGYRTFLFDPNADMSPPVSTTRDWAGNEVVMKESSAELRLGDGPPRRVPIDRSRHYPVFESWMGTTGVVGSIGIASLGSDRFVIDRARGEVRIASAGAPAPVVPPSPPVPAPAPVAPSPRVCNNGVRGGESACTAEGHGTAPGAWFTYCGAERGGGATRCNVSPATPVCVARIVGGRSTAACCPPGRANPWDPGCVTPH